MSFISVNTTDLPHYPSLRFITQAIAVMYHDNNQRGQTHRKLESDRWQFGRARRTGRVAGLRVRWFAAAQTSAARRRLSLIN